MERQISFNESAEVIQPVGTSSTLKSVDEEEENEEKETSSEGEEESSSGEDGDNATKM